MCMGADDFGFAQSVVASALLSRLRLGIDKVYITNVVKNFGFTQFFVLSLCRESAVEVSSMIY